MVVLMDLCLARLMVFELESQREWMWEDPTVLKLDELRDPRMATLLDPCSAYETE